MEEKTDQLARLALMADEKRGSKWDLSDNDRAAIEMVLEERDALRSALRDLATYAAAYEVIHQREPEHPTLTKAREVLG